MASRQRLFSFLSLIIILSLLLVACERPIPGNSVDNSGDQETDLVGGETDGTDPNAGGGAGDPNAGGVDSPAESGDDPYPPPPDDGDGEPDGDDGYPPPDDDDGDDGDSDDGDGDDGDSDDGDGDDGDSDDGDGDDGDSDDGDGDDGDSDDGDGDDGDCDDGDGDDGDSDDGDSDDGDSDDGDSDDSDSDGSDGDEENGDTPATHTVAKGENLYRIGLKYGMSWVTIAQINNLHNPHHIYVGQVLKLSADDGGSDGDGDTGGQDDPTPPEQDVEYIVKVGDTLYSIGKAFGVDWKEIAEKNHIVNPHHILVGQTLIIPGTAADSTEPQQTHTVMYGETLFRISLKYGIPWTNIAEANDISSPHVIYPGQVLVIPEG